MNSLPDYLQSLEYDDGAVFPAAALNEAVRQREEAIPFLLGSLEWACEHPYAENEVGDVYALHIHALFLLASFREPRAYPLVLRMFQHPDADAIVGDLTVEIGDRILASVCCGQDTGPIEQAIEDPEQDEMVRVTLAVSLGILSHCGFKPREEVVGYFRELLQSRVEPDDSIFWNRLLEVCVDLRMTELLPEIRRLYRDNTESSNFLPLEKVEFEIFQASLPAARIASYALIGDPVPELEAWEASQGKIDYIFEKAVEGSPDLGGGASIFEAFNAPRLGYGNTPRPAPKVGRNDQCPCGSGKKFKKCCGKDASA